MNKLFEYLSMAFLLLMLNAVLLLTGCAVDSQFDSSLSKSSLNYHPVLVD